MSKTKEIFLDQKIVKNPESKALRLFSDICPDFTEYKESPPSDFIAHFWKEYQNHPEKDNNSNGKVFEYMLASILMNSEILPFYMQAKVAFVPNVDYDLLLYCKEKGPIVLSAKTSLRERYKQADLESIALKYVHRKSESYLITVHEDEAASVEKKIKSGDVIGINKVILAHTLEFDNFMSYLQNNNDFERAGQIDIIKSSVYVE